MIWREMFFCPTEIVPGYLIWDASLRASYKIRHKVYGYQFDDARQESYSLTNIPSSRTLMNIDLVSTTRPTVDQNQTIAAGVTSFETIDEISGMKIQHLVHRRHDDNSEINRKKSAIFGFRGVGALQTCKQINEEASQILYGENCFVFDTRFHAEHTNIIWTSNFIKEFHSLSHLIPGFPTKNGFEPSPKQISTAVQRLFWFDKKTHPPDFLHYDPLARFLNEAGRKNASLITRVKIQGHFKTGPRHADDQRPLGLARVLPIYQTILKEVCSSFRGVVLDISPGNPLQMDPRDCDYLVSHSWAWNGVNTNDDYPGTLHFSDEDKIDHAVEKLVQGLPGLRKLQLGDYKYKTVPEGVDEWGKSVRWMKIVEERAQGISNTTPTAVVTPVNASSTSNDGLI